MSDDDYPVRTVSERDFLRREVERLGAKVNSLEEENADLRAQEEKLRHEFGLLFDENKHLRAGLEEIIGIGGVGCCMIGEQVARRTLALDRRTPDSTDSAPTQDRYRFKGNAQVKKLTRETQTQSGRALVEKSRRRDSRGRTRRKATRRDT